MSETGKEQKNVHSGKLRIEWANGRIIVLDADANRMLIGQDPDGEIKIKLSAPGKNVLTAENEDLIFSSDFNLFKIEKAGILDIPVGSGDTVVTGFVDHDLGIIPAVLCWAEETAIDAGNIRQIPTVWANSGASLLLIKYIVTDTTLTFDIRFPSAANFYGAAHFKFHYFLMRRSIGSGSVSGGIGGPF